MKTGVELIGEPVIVVMSYLNNKYICALQDNREIECYSELPIKIGSTVYINSYISNTYYI